MRASQMKSSNEERNGHFASVREDDFEGAIQSKNLERQHILYT